MDGEYITRRTVPYSTRTTHQNLGIGAGRRKVLGDVLLGYKADTPSPSCWGVVENVVDLEPVREHGDQVIQFDAQQDVFLSNVGVDEAELGWVTGVEEGVADNLEHGGDASSAGNKTKLLGQGWGVDELALGSLDADIIADLEQRKVSGDVALLVGLR